MNIDNSIKQKIINEFENIGILLHYQFDTFYIHEIPSECFPYPNYNPLLRFTTIFYIKNGAMSDDFNIDNEINNEALKIIKKYNYKDSLVFIQNVKIYSLFEEKLNLL